MLQLSDTAADALQEVRNEQEVPDTFGVRVSTQPGPDGQPGLAIGFTEGPAEGDEVTEHSGLELYVSEDIAEPLAQSVLDIQDTDQGAQLVVKPQDDTAS